MDYIMKCSNDEYEQYKEILDLYNPYIINMKDYIWVLLYCTNEQYELLKSYGLHISVDTLDLKTC